MSDFLVRLSPTDLQIYFNTFELKSKEIYEIILKNIKSISFAQKMFKIHKTTLFRAVFVTKIKNLQKITKYNGK